MSKRNQYEHFNEEVFMALTEESKLKVEAIYNIADILHTHSVRKLSVEEFDILYDKSLNDLAIICGNVKAVTRAEELDGE